VKGCRYASITAAATVAIGVLTAITLWAVLPPPHAHRGLDIAVAVAAFAIVPAIVRWPLGGGLASALLAALSPVGTPAASFAALNAARWRRFPAGLAVAAAGIAAHAVQGWWRPAGGLSYVWWLALMAAAYAALVGWGALARSRAALLASLRERARRAEAEQGRRVAEARAAERTQIAREMHDVLAHRLSLLATYAGAVEYRPDAAPDQLARAAGVVRDGAHQALDELRQVIAVLRDDEAELDDRPQPNLSDLDGLLGETRDAGTPVRLDDRAPRRAELPAALGRTAYRVVQEALTNARKHAPGQSVTLTLDGGPGEGLVIAIDNPIAPGTSAPPGSGMGLVGLTERVQLAGGQLDHERRGDAFHVRARLPWK
jgi:signal transduction histidine kinase